MQRDAISPGRNLLKSYGFKFKRAVTYFTQYNMIPRDNHVDPSQHTVDDFSVSNLEGSVHCLSQYVSGHRNRRTVLMEDYSGAGPYRVLLLLLHSFSNYFNITTLLLLESFRFIDILKYVDIYARYIFLSIPTKKKISRLEDLKNCLTYHAVTISECIFLTIIFYR